MIESTFQKTMNEAYKRLVGVWTNVDDTVIFMFTDPEINYNKKVLTYQINGKIENIIFFLSMLDNNRFRLYIQIPTRLFSNRLILEFIGKDCIELKYYDDYIFTLLKIPNTADLKKFFEVQ